MSDPITETLSYYEKNAETYARRSLQKLDLAPLERFCDALSPSSLILDAGCGAGRDLAYFLSRGHQAEGFDGSERLVEIARKNSGASVWRADYRLLSLQRSKYDGIWAHRSLIHLPAAGCQRALASFFVALRPAGSLFVSIETGAGERADRTDDPSGPARWIYAYDPDDFLSLVRQSGFQPLATGQDPEHPSRLGIFARRL